jgi:hypothetical protein
MGEIERILPIKSGPEARLMSLEGAETLTLNLKEIGCKMAALNEQITLLQKALTERKELRREIYSERSELAESTGDPEHPFEIFWIDD